MGERRGAYRFLVEKYRGRRLLGRPRHRWKDNIKMDHREVELGAWVESTLLKTGISGNLL
jgi:hypothetical protein